MTPGESHRLEAVARFQHHGRWRNIRSLDPYYRKTSTWGTTNPATPLAQHDN
ncbi:MAG: hypothetical protein ACRD2C_17540 [Acidimicrobiales bacterium]